MHVTAVAACMLLSIQKVAGHVLPAFIILAWLPVKYVAVYFFYNSFIFFITKSRARLLCFFCFLKMKKYPVASRYFFS